MSVFLAGLLVFLGIHSVSIVAPAWRDRQVARLGEGPWKGLYSLISIAGFVALIYGYGMARQDPTVIYSPPAELRHVTMLFMLPVFPLLIAAYVPGHIRRGLKHPMLLAVIFWAIAHLLANGTLDDLLLFGGFLVWAVADMVSASQRGRTPAAKAPSTIYDVIAVVVGLGLYAFVLLWAHAQVIGMAPVG
jgi:uncharacterized membrane protein